jgi:hypothetical protein
VSGSRSSRRLGLVLWWAGLGLAVPLAAGAVPRSDEAPQLSSDQDASGQNSAPQVPDAWRELLRRDATLTFSRSSAERAAAELEAGLEDPLREAAALYVLGATGALSHLVLLESAAERGSGLGRLGAILGLGELDLAPVPLLLRQLADPSEEVRGATLLALLRSRDPLALSQVAPLVGAPGPIGTLVERLVEYVDRPEQSRPSAPVGLLLTVRWRAAVEYGLVEGQTWRARRTAELEQDPAFLDLVVLPIAAQTRWHAARDHLVALLIEEPSVPVFDACLRSLPAELNLIVRSDIWAPADEAQWADLLGAIERSGRAVESIDVIDRAFGVPSLRRRAALLLLAAGDDRGWEVVAPLLAEGGSPADRIQVAQALGRSGDTDWLVELQRLAIDPDAQVRAAALAARVQLAELTAYDECLTIIGAKDDGERETVARALFAVSGDARAQRLLEQALLVTVPPLSVEVAAVLCSEGRVGARRVVREALAGGQFPELSVPLVRAIAGFADADDLDRLRSLFPTEGDLLLDVELARALVRNRDALGLRLLRSAVWVRSWHQSAMASFLLADYEGLPALHAELQAPPPRASPTDLRRLGFALGELGGMGEVEVLARRRTSADPALQGAYLGALSSRTF